MERRIKTEREFKLFSLVCDKGMAKEFLSLSKITGRALNIVFNRHKHLLDGCTCMELEEYINWVCEEYNL